MEMNKQQNRNEYMWSIIKDDKCVLALFWSMADWNYSAITSSAMCYKSVQFISMQPYTYIFSQHKILQKLTAIHGYYSYWMEVLYVGMYLSTPGFITHSIGCKF